MVFLHEVNDNNDSYIFQCSLFFFKSEIKLLRQCFVKVPGSVDLLHLPVLASCS